MKAMVLRQRAPIETSPLRAVEIEPPRPHPGEVRVKVRCCALCRTDLHVVEGDLTGGKLPVIPGHQVVGVVDQLGDGCKQLKPGDRVGIAWLRHTCGTCRFCATGRENLCPCSKYTGYDADGGYAEYATVPEDYAYPLPDGIGDIDASPLLCGGIIGYRAVKRANVQCGGTVALFGFGSSAHLVLQLLRGWGCAVYVVTRGQTHQQLARELGAAWAGHDAAAMPAKVQSAIVFAPSGKVVLPALDCLDSGGTVSLAGIHMSPIPELDYDKSLYRERDIHPVTSNTRDDGRKWLADAVKLAIKPRVATYPLADANGALNDLKSGRVDGTGVLVVHKGE